MRCLIAIVGPTAVGKSELAIHLAQNLNGEIVSADSRKVYRYMDIGTAKPTPQERALIPHHLIDIIDPDEELGIALYQEKAYSAIEDIQERGRLPILVGGSGLYVRSVIDGWRIPNVPPDPELRRNLEERAKEEGCTSLYEELERSDPVAAERIDPRNLRRVIRALEVCYRAGPFSQLQGKEMPPFRVLTIGLTTSRDELYRRIDKRVDQMMEEGFVEEVEGLMDRGYTLELPSMSGVGYRQIGMYIQGRMDLDEAVRETKLKTHRFARRQYAWFRLDDERIRWFNIGEEFEGPIERLILEFASGKVDKLIGEQ